MLYGNDAMRTPAISAPISFDSPAQSAAPAITKHQAIVVTSISSEDLAMARNSGGSTKRPARIAAPKRATPLPAETRSGGSCRCVRFGWRARNAIA